MVERMVHILAILFDHLFIEHVVHRIAHALALEQPCSLHDLQMLRASRLTDPQDLGDVAHVHAVGLMRADDLDHLHPVYIADRFVIEANALYKTVFSHDPPIACL